MMIKVIAAGIKATVEMLGEQAVKANKDPMFERDGKKYYDEPGFKFLEYYK